MDQLKKLMSSMLISCKEGVRLEDIERDYLATCGDPLPYRKLGFPNVAALMDAIPDVAYVKRDSYGAIRYAAKGDESTQHILKLVSHQKSSRKPAKSRPRHIAHEKMSQPSYHAFKAAPKPAYSQNLHLKPKHFGNVGMAATGVALTSLSKKPTSGGEKTQDLLSFSHSSSSGPMKQPPVMTITYSSSGRTVVAESSTKQALPKISTNMASSHGQPAPLSRFLPGTFRGQASTQAVSLDSSQATTADGKVGAASLSATSQFQGKVGPFASSSSRPCTRTPPASASVQASLSQLAGHTHGQVSSSDQEAIRQKVKKMLAAKPNGINLNKLGIVYKSTIGEEPPANLQELVKQWTDILVIEETKLEGNEYSIVYEKKDTPASLTEVDSKQTAKQKTGSQVYGNSVVKPFSSLTIGISTECIISHMISVNEFYVHVIGCSITEIMDAMHDHYKEEDTPEEIYLIDPSCVNCFCAVKDPEFNAWSRGCILGVGSDTANVFFIDFGNIAAVPHSSVRPLAKELAKQEAQAIRCCLPGFPQSGISVEQQDSLTSTFLQLAEDKRLTAVAIRALKNPVCMETDLYITKGMKFVGDSLKAALSLPTSTPNQLMVHNVPALQLPTDTYWDVSVSYVESHSSVVVQLYGSDYLDRLMEMTQQAQKIYTSEDGIKTRARTAVAGRLYMVNTEDSWFRMTVLPSSLLQESASSTKVLCAFFDYGDSSWVSLSDMYEMEPQFMAVPCQAVVCELDGLDEVPATAADRVFDALCSLTVGKSLVAFVDTTNGNSEDTRLLTLYDTTGSDDININSKLLGIALTIDHDEFKDGASNWPSLRVSSPSQEPVRIGCEASKPTVTASNSVTNHEREGNNPVAYVEDPRASTSCLAQGEPAPAAAFSSVAADARAFVPCAVQSGDSVSVVGMNVSAAAGAAAKPVRPAEDLKVATKLPLASGRSIQAVQQGGPEEGLTLREDPLVFPFALSPLAKGQLLGVYITQAINPYHFTAVPYNHLLALKCLVADMTATYGGSPHNTPVSSIVSGGWYAAYSSGTCYRVKVMAKNSTGQVHVCLVDFGDHEFMAPTSLLTLQSKHKELPPLAMYMKLAGVKPLGGRDTWSNESARLFSELTIDKFLVAKATAETKATATVRDERTEVLLIDTSDANHDKYISKQLIDSGHAEPGII